MKKTIMHQLIFHYSLKKAAVILITELKQAKMMKIDNIFLIDDLIQQQKLMEKMTLVWPT